MSVFFNFIFVLILGCETSEEEIIESNQADVSDIDEIPMPSADNPPEEEDSSDDNDNDSDTEDNDTGSADIEEEPEPVTLNYRFSDEDSLLYVQVFKDTTTAASGMAHNHVMRATNWSGVVNYNTGDIDACSFEFSLPVHDLKVDETAMRQLVGYGDSISDNDRNTIRGHMLAENQLNGDAYPNISFESTSCSLSNDSLVVTGDMTIRGYTREMDIEMDFTPLSDRFYMTGQIDFTHTQFNFSPYSAFWGAVRNQDGLKITFDMVGINNL
jgi:polyisoprenoid-binding protein YceI